ncbi:MAG: GNAT family N-acetyltransferase [Erysipelotrichaceae bacterium]|nr:GNAT family N-acetyltransferase [Erysipelotrichaceae bacterium]
MNERRSIDEFLAYDSKDTGMLVIREDGHFSGLMITMTYKDICHIIYFAVKPEYRDKGYGTRCLKLLQQNPDRIIVDVEDPEAECDNRRQRKRRVEFYRKNGFERTGISYNWRGEQYFIMSFNGTVTKDEFSAFWDYFSHRASNNIG